MSIGDGGKIAGVGVWEGTTVGGNHPGANREATRGIYWNTGASSVGTLVADDIDVYHSWIDGVNPSGLFGSSLGPVVTMTGRTVDGAKKMGTESGLNNESNGRKH